MKDNFMTLTKQYGKPICVALYAVSAAMAARKRVTPFLSLLGMHAAEYWLIGKNVAAEKGLTKGEGLAQCLAFGFTWWLPEKQA